MSIRSSKLLLLTLSASLLAACTGEPQPADAPPTVMLSLSSSALSSGIVTAPGDVVLSAEAKDDRAVSKVEFFDNDKSVGVDSEAPYTLKRSYIDADEGKHTLKAVVTDSSAQTASDSQEVTVSRKAPAPDVTAPVVSVKATPAALTASGSVEIAATATDDVGVSKVELYDNTVKVGEALTAPYAFTLSYGPKDNGTHALSVRATDASGNTAEASSTVKVEIVALSLTAAPQVLTYPGPVTLTAVANAEAGHSITKVDFLEGSKVLATQSAAPYSAVVNYTAAQNGEHKITARSTDDAGTTSEASTTVTVALDFNEPNETAATAKAIVIGSRIDGNIAGLPRDRDFFSFAAKAGDQLRLTVKSQSIFASSTLDPYVQVLLPDAFTVLEKDDDSGKGLESDLRFNIPKDGTYFIDLTSFKIHDDAVATDNLLSNTYRLELTRR